MTGRRLWIVAAVVFFAGSVVASGVYVAGCGTATEHVSPISDIEAQLAATAEGDFSATVAEAEQHWANRSNQSDVEAAIATWELSLTFETPGDRADDLFPVLVSISRAHYFLADAHISFEPETSERDALMHATYQTGVEYGNLAWQLNNDEWRRALLYETPIPDAVSVTTPADIPAMYWYSTNLGRWALLDGTPTILAHKDDIAAIMNRMAEMDRQYFFGASDRYFGVFYTKIPLGNPDLDRSRAHFETAIEIEPNYFATRVLFASEYATKVQDRDLYIEQLEYVINHDASTLADVQPENEAEQRKAQILLDDVDEYFR